MAISGVSKDILTQAYASSKYDPPAELGTVVRWKGADFVCMKAVATIAAGDCVALKASANPSLCTITKTDNTSVVTAGLAVGFAMVAAVDGDYVFVWVGGPRIAECPTVTNDGGDFALGDFIIPDISGTDGQVVKGTAGTHDHLQLGVVTTAITGTSMDDEWLFNRMGFRA